MKVLFSLNPPNTQNTYHSVHRNHYFLHTLGRKSRLMKNACCLSLLALLLASCGPSQPPSEKEAVPELLAYFAPAAPLPDTLYISSEEDTTAAAKLIPDSLLLAALDSALIEQLTFDGSLEETECHALLRFPLDEAHEACLMEIRQYWFLYKPLLIYDRANRRFTGAELLAYLYGGESGQIAAESWLLDLNGDGKKELLTRHQEHWLEWAENQEDVTDHFRDSVSARVWNGAAFQDYPLPDTAAYIRAFPMGRLR